MFYVVLGLLLAAHTLAGLVQGLPSEHHGPRLQEIIPSLLSLVLFWKSTKAERVPALLLSGAFVILINRWLFGYGRTTALVGLVFALLAALAGFRGRHQIAPVPRETDWANDWPLVALMAIALMFWFYSMS